MKITKLKQYYPASTVIAAKDREAFIYCSATTQDMRSPRYSEWRKHRYSSDEKRPYSQCRRIACVRIGDKPFCAAHAGRIALDLWIRGDLQNVGRMELPEKKKPKKTPKSSRPKKSPRLED